MRPLISALAVAAALSAPSALAQTADRPDTQAGRYMLREVDGEFLRVDRETGDTSICRRDGASWTCTLVADDRVAYEAEIDRLSEENAELARQVDLLRQELTALRALAPDPDVEPAPELEGEPGETPQPAPDAGQRTDNEAILDLPSDEDLDRLSETFELVMKRFVEMLRSLKSDLEQQNEPQNPQ